MDQSSAGGLPQQIKKANGREFSSAVQGATGSHAGAQSSVSKPKRKKDYVVTLALGFFLGLYGGDRFYLGKTGTALIKLFTAGGYLVWWVIDLYMLAAGRATDSDGNVIAYEGPNEKTIQRLSWIAFWVAASMIGLFLIFAVIGVIAAIMQAM
jgi:TM2 domain-containing membrane protein YozV